MDAQDNVKTGGGLDAAASGTTFEKRVSLPRADLSRTHFQYLEDLATGYWYSEVLFAALELRLFDWIEKEPAATEELAGRVCCHVAALKRLLEGMAALGLVRQHRGAWVNAQLSRIYLLSDKPGYLGDFLLYRRYLQNPWRNLSKKVALDARSVSRGLCAADSYAARNLHYVRSLDALARHKAGEIFTALAAEGWDGPVLDVGGGAGALCRRAMQEVSVGGGVVLDLPEVLAAAGSVYPDPESWRGLWRVAADARDPWPVSDRAFGLVILSNVLHAYNAREARALLGRAVLAMRPGGLLVIHDYFPDSPSAGAKGALYDLNMMLNTFDGCCHRIGEVRQWLMDTGCAATRLRRLPSDSDLVLAGGRADRREMDSVFDELLFKARGLGFVNAALILTEKIVVAGWVRLKCRFGCSRYARGGACPPNGKDDAQTAALIRSYRKALLVEGEPPGRAFHLRLLAMEKQAFLAGFHKVLGFGAGPCPLCDSCPDDGGCRFPENVRPSMEASGIDVYATAAAGGIGLTPVVNRGEHVKYIGLLLLE